MPLTLDPRRLDAFLTAPTPALGDDAERQQARLLARLLLLAGGLVLGLSLALPAFRPLPQTTYLTYFKRQPGGLVGLALGVGLLGAYWLSRTTHWQRAANLAGLLFQAGIAAGILASAEPDSAASLLVLQVIPILLYSLFLSARWTVAAILLNMLVAAALLCLPAYRSEAVVDGGLAAFIASALILVARQHRDRLEAIRQAHLAAINRELADSNHKARLAAQQAHEASRLKSEFLANTSHELRTPLNAINGFTAFLADGRVPLDSAKASDLIRRVHANGQRLLELIDHLLDLSRIQSQRLEVTYAPYSPRQLAEETIITTRHLLGDKPVTYHCQVDDQLPQTLLGDQELIRSILLNLESNAIKFTDQGSIRLTLAPDPEDGGHWIISVADTGIGIVPHLHETIFEAFRQADGSTQRTHGGSGLGLSIVQGIVQTLGGSIKLDSQPGQGTTITIRLPIHRPDAPPPDAPASADATPAPHPPQPATAPGGLVL